MNIIVETTTLTKGDEVLSRSERKLYTLRQLKDEEQVGEYPDGIVPHDVGRAYENAMEWISQTESEFWEGEYVVDQALEILADAGLTLPPKEHYKPGHQWQAQPSYDISYVQGSMWFAMPSSTIVDVDRFLRAMKRWASDKGWTPLDYKPGQKFTLRRFSHTDPVDLRRKDYRVIREQGLVVHEVSSHFSYPATDRFDQLEPGYGEWDPYEGVSDEVKEMCNEFIQDLCHLAMVMIRDEYEYVTSDEDHLMETAEANEWLFTKDGKIA